MNKINNVGMKLIEYKTELLKDYPQIVKDSLILALDKLLETKILDVDTYYLIKDESHSIDEFSEYLLTKKAYSKTEQEILQELEILRKRFNDKLENLGIGYDLRTESIVDKEIVMASKKFIIDEKFVMDYFGVSEKDVLQLTKRRGFVEKFAVLRLPKIFNDFLNKITYPKELLKVDASLVYFDEEDLGNAIDLVFEVGVEQLENEEELEQICEKIKELKEDAEEFYRERMVC